MDAEGEDRPLVALGLVFLASLAFASLAAAIKECAPQTGLATPIFARGAIGLLACLAWAARSGESLRPNGTGALLARCACGVTAMYAYYWAYTSGGTDLPSAVVLLKTAPLWVALLAPLLLAEAHDRRVWVALGVGLVGVGLRYGVSLQGEQWGLLASLAAGLLSALAYMALRKLGRSDPPLVVVAWFSGFLVLVTLPGVVGAVEGMADWSGTTWGLLVLIGSLGTVGQVCLTAAYRFGAAAAVTVGGLVEVGIALLYSLLLFGEEPTTGALVGGGLALAAGVLANLRRANQATTSHGDAVLDLPQGPEQEPTRDR
jgi:drug/metabolite transporter (DMT)-like permease